MILWIGHMPEIFNEKQIEFQKWWEKLDDNERQHSFECQSGGYLDFVIGKGALWIVTPEFVSEMYRPSFE